MGVRRNLLYGWQRIPEQDRHLQPEAIIEGLNLGHLLDRGVNLPAFDVTGSFLLSVSVKNNGKTVKQRPDRIPHLKTQSLAAAGGNQRTQFRSVTDANDKF